MFSDSTVDIAIDQIKAALKSVEKNLGVEIDLTGIRYSEEEFYCTMTVLKAGSESRQEREYNFQTTLNPKLPALGSIIEPVGGKIKYKIMGWKSRNRKFPILAKRMDNGNLYKMTTRQVEKARIVQKITL